MHMKLIKPMDTHAVHVNAHSHVCNAAYNNVKITNKCNMLMNDFTAQKQYITSAHLVR